MNVNQKDRKMSSPVLNVRQSHRSRHLISNEQWEAHREEIYTIYVEKNNNLRNTMKAMEETHSFRASMRKYKMKIKEWKFDKYLRANDMKFIVAKATKRAREDGKETTFCYGGQQISSERIENFKKRVALDEGEIASHTATTPVNITYHTPCPSNNSVSLDVGENDLLLTDSFDPFYSLGIDLDLGHEELVRGMSSRTISDMPGVYDRISSSHKTRNKESDIPTPDLEIIEECTKIEMHTSEDPWSLLNLVPFTTYNQTVNQEDMIWGLHDCYDDSFSTFSRESTPCYYQSAEELKGLLRGFLDVRSNVLHVVGKTFQEIKSSNDALDLIDRLFERLKEFDLEDKDLTVAMALATHRIWHKEWDTPKLALSEMKSLLANNSQNGLDFRLLIYGMCLACNYSFLGQTSSAHSIFSSLLPHVWVNSGPKCGWLIANSYFMFGFHYWTSELFTEANDYFLLAYECFFHLNMLDAAADILDLQSKASTQMRNGTHRERESMRRKEFESIEMDRVGRLLKDFKRARPQRKTVGDVGVVAETQVTGEGGESGEGGDGSKERVGEEMEDTITDVTSCKYGMTYSVSDITGISDSVFMVP